MLPSLILNFFALLGQLLVRLAYQEEGINACETLEKDTKTEATLFGLGFMIWILTAFMTIYGIVEGHFSIGATMYTIVYALIYIIWFLNVRSNLPELIERAKTYTEQKVERESIIKKGAPIKSNTSYAPIGTTTNVPGWQCECGRVNADYVMTCSCGITKKEMKLRNQQKQEPDQSN